MQNQTDEGFSKKICILCDMFPPAFAPRMGYLCKYMKRAGWEPVVVAEYISEHMFAFLDGICDVSYVDFYPSQYKILNKIRWFATMVADFLFQYKEWRMARMASRIVAQGGFGAVLCSTYRTFPLPAAYRVATRFNLPLIADHRDIIEQYAGTEYIAHKLTFSPWVNRMITALFTRKLLREHNKILSKAECVTTVSKWHAETLRKYNPNVQLIYNGYDPELFYPEQIPTKEFSLTYTGRILSFAIRDPHPLFEAIVLLHKEGTLSPAECRVKWYMDPHSVQLVSDEASRYGISEYMDFHPIIEASKVPDILNRSSILLQLANLASEHGPKGIMSTKVFEALAVGKPLLCVRSDEGCLEATIKEAEAGGSARNAEEAALFIRHYYKQWKEQGYTSVRSKEEIVKKYSRKEQAQQFMNIFTKLQQKR